MRHLTYIFLLALSTAVHAQKPWTIDSCMQYAVSHNHDVRQQAIALDDYKTERTRATGALLPSVNGSIGAQYNFGRAIDPETNTYTNVSTFYNSYGLSASLPVFDGFQRLNDIKAARVNVLLGKSRLTAQKDATAQQVLETCIQLLYYKGCIDMAQQKRKESEMLLRQTQLMAEIGQKSEADVAQMQATFATDDYEVTRQQGLYETTLLTLKQQMNFPINTPLEITDSVGPLPVTAAIDVSNIYAFARLSNPDIKQAEYSLQSAKYALRSSRGALLPSISVGAGVSTTYYKQLNVPGVTPFSQQFRNNAGEYVYATLSIPIFNRLNTLSNIRRQRNNVRRAQEELEYRNSELQRLIQEAITDQRNSQKETEKMERKVEADSIAAHLTVRKFEEGLASSIDVQTQAVTLLQSKAQLLQSRLTYIYKSRMLNYYKGIPLWTE